MTAPVMLASPFPRRLAAYLAERFPLAKHGVLIAAYASSNHFLAQALVEPERRLAYDGRFALIALALLGFFFHLRVFDEHKDFAEDSRHYPDRVLQRGLVTLGHLRWLGGIAIGLELAAAMLCGRAALVAWLIAFGYSLLMLEEFFLRQWLKERFFLYATSHLAVMPLLALTVFSFTTGLYPWQAPGLYLLYAWVGFFVTFNWEVSRKIRAPEDEIEGVDSYTRLFGTHGAANLVLLLRGIDTALVAAVGWRLGLAAWFYAALVALFAVCLVSYVQYRAHPNRATAKRMETWAGIYVIAFDVLLAVELVRRYGLEVRVW